MAFRLQFTEKARDQLADLVKDERKLRKVNRCLALIADDPRYPGLHTHEYQSLKLDDGREVWQSYVENRTSAAWRVFWAYGPEKESITIVAITEHP